MKKILITIIILLAVSSLLSCQRKAMKTVEPFAAGLPDDIKPDYIVSYGDKNITVQEKLIELRAHTENGKLLDDDKREIRFYRIACFGNPPDNYDEIRQREREEIARLRQDYTVIIMECDPMIQ
jgi:hypothetical protein